MKSDENALVTDEEDLLLPALNVEVGKVLLQVLLDEVIRGLFGLTEPSDDEGKGVSQRLHLLSSFLETVQTGEARLNTSRQQGRALPAWSLQIPDNDIQGSDNLR